jgi:hypothetical protein
MATVATARGVDLSDRQIPEPQNKFNIRDINGCVAIQLLRFHSNVQSQRPQIQSSGLPHPFKQIRRDLLHTWVGAPGCSPVSGRCFVAGGTA